MRTMEGNKMTRISNIKLYICSALSLLLLFLGISNIMNGYICLIISFVFLSAFIVLDYLEQKKYSNKMLLIIILPLFCVLVSLILLAKIHVIALTVTIILLILCMYIYEYSKESKEFVNCVLAIGISAILMEIISIILLNKYFVTSSSTALAIFNIAIISVYLVLIISIVLFYNEKLEFAKMILINIILLGLLYNFILPPLTAPDEDCHFAMSYSYSNVLLGGKRSVGIDENYQTGNYYIIPCREADAICFKENYSSDNVWLKTGQKDYINFYNGLFQYTGLENQFSSTFTGRFIGNYSFLAYLPATLGITLARVIGLSGMSLIYLGRIFNLIFYAIMIYVAIKKIPFGKKTLAVIATLPMALHLAASYSYDAILIASSFVFLSYVFSLIMEDRYIDRSDIIWIFVSLIFLTSAKIIYSFIIILALFIPKNRFRKGNNKYIFCTCLLIATVLLILFGSIGGIKAYTNTVEGTELYTFSYILKHLSQTIYVYLKTIWVNGLYYFKGMFGNYLGWLNIKVSSKLIYLFVAIFLLSIPSSKEEKLPSRKYSLFSLVLGLSLLAILLAATIMWNRVDTNIFYGFQGRYALEILPLIAIGFISDYNPLVYKYDISKSLLFVSIPLHIVLLLQVFIIIMVR